MLCKKTPKNAQSERNAPSMLKPKTPNDRPSSHSCKRKTLEHISPNTLSHPKKHQLPRRPPSSCRAHIPAYSTAPRATPSPAPSSPPASPPSAASGSTHPSPGNSAASTPQARQPPCARCPCPRTGSPWPACGGTTARCRLSFGRCPCGGRGRAWRG